MIDKHENWSWRETILSERSCRFLILDLVMLQILSLQMTLTVTELKENLKRTDEDAKMKELKITSLQNDMSNKDSELKKVCKVKT